MFFQRFDICTETSHNSHRLILTLTILRVILPWIGDAVDYEGIIGVSKKLVKIQLNPFNDMAGN